MFFVRDWFCKRHALAILTLMNDSSMKHLTQNHLDMFQGSSSPIIFFHRRKKSQSYLCVHHTRQSVRVTYDLLVYID